MSWLCCGAWSVSYPTGLPGKPDVGVLRVSTRTHPCDASTQAGRWRHQSASSFVRACDRVLQCAGGRVCGRWLCGVVLSDISTSGQHVFVKSSNSFRHAYLEYHSHVRLRFKLAAGLGQPWTRDGCTPQGA